jgi:hypothetical protein
MAVGGDEESQRDVEANGAAVWPEELFENVELPEAEGSVKELIERGEVRFVFYDSTKYRRKYQGETRFEMVYDAPFEFRWRQVRLPSGKSELRIRPRFGEVRLRTSHRILLPMNLVGPDFYRHPLVLHELDHVEISAAANWHTTFVRWLKNELREVRCMAEENDSKQELTVRTAVKAEVQTRFDQLLELVRIRYQDLDARTQHGALPNVKTDQVTD